MLTTLAALLAGLVPPIGILAPLTGRVLATLLATLMLILLAAPLTATLLLAILLLALILIHRSLLGISPSPLCQLANMRRVPEVPRMLNPHARSLSGPRNAAVFDRGLSLWISPSPQKLILSLMREGRS
jgi:hypothetical protein